MSQLLVLVGNLGRDPEMRYTPSGAPVTSFSLASSESFKTAEGETKEETTWFRVSVWGKQAEPCHQFLKSGSQVYVEGKLTPDENGHPKVWKGNDGIAHASFEVRAAKVKFLTPKSKGEADPDAVALIDGSASEGSEEPTAE